MLLELETTLRKYLAQGPFTRQADELRVYPVCAAVKVNRGNTFHVHGICNAIVCIGNISLSVSSQIVVLFWKEVKCLRNET